MGLATSKRAGKLDMTHNSLINPPLSQPVIPERTILIADPRFNANPLDALSDVDTKIKALLSTVHFKSELLGEKKEKDKEKEKEKKPDMDLSISTINEGKGQEKRSRRENARSQLKYGRDTTPKNSDETPLRRLYDKDGGVSERRH